MTDQLTVTPCNHPGAFIGTRCILCGEFNLRFKRIKQPESDMSMLYQDDFDQNKWSKTLDKMTRGKK